MVGEEDMEGCGVKSLTSGSSWTAKVDVWFEQSKVDDLRIMSI